MIDERLQKLSASLNIQRLENLDLTSRIHRLERTGFADNVLIKAENSALKNELANFKWYNRTQLIGAFLAGGVFIAGILYSLKYFTP